MFYHRTVRGHNNSWAALSTCDGLVGVFNDGIEMYHVQRVPDTDPEANGVNPGIGGRHFLYKHSGKSAEKSFLA
jgi:hypothetical protein